MENYSFSFQSWSLRARYFLCMFVSWVIPANLENNLYLLWKLRLFIAQGLSVHINNCVLHSTSEVMYALYNTEYIETSPQIFFSTNIKQCSPALIMFLINEVFSENLWMRNVSCNQVDSTWIFTMERENDDLLCNINWRTMVN